MLKTAECVTPMHPDKICDRISDAILDECLNQDPNSRVACEVMGGHGIITITGEITSLAYVDCQSIARAMAGDENYGVQVNLVKQSGDIANGVNPGGAGDQGIMVGYACDETPELMPLEVMLARRLCQYLFSFFPVDGKTQITIDSETHEVKAIVASFCGVSGETLRLAVDNWIVENQADILIVEPAIHCNPAGDWSIGGFKADTGLTGRKLAVDAYGPSIAIGGGAFSGKDASKVDRSGAYMARRIAVDLLRANNAAQVYVYLAYAIGQAEPVQAIAIIDGVSQPVVGYDLAPNGIVNHLNLKSPIFGQTANWGHFGNGFAWEI